MRAVPSDQAAVACPTSWLGRPPGNRRIRRIPHGVPFEATLSMVSPMWLFNRKGPDCWAITATSHCHKYRSEECQCAGHRSERQQNSPELHVELQSKTYEIRSAPLRSSAQGIGPPLTALERFFGPPYSRGCILLKVMYLMFDRCAGRVGVATVFDRRLAFGSPTGACKPSVILPSSWNNQRVERPENERGIEDRHSSIIEQIATDSCRYTYRSSENWVCPGDNASSIVRRPLVLQCRWEIEQAEPFGPV